MRTSRGPSESDAIRVPVDHRAAGTRHPNAVALDAAVQFAAVLVLKIEGFEIAQQYVR